MTGTTLAEKPAAESCLSTAVPTSAHLEAAGKPAAKVSDKDAHIGKRTRVQRARVWVVPMSLLLGIGYAGFAWWGYARSWVSTDNAFVAGHIHQVSSRVAGTVLQVAVSDNQRVQAGVEVARLDPRDFETALEQAKALQAQALAVVRTAQSQVDEAAARLLREKSQAEKLQRDLERARTLSEDKAGAISRQEYDAALAARDTSAAAVNVASAALESAQAQAGAAHAQVQAAQAKVKEIELQLSYTHILAPADGRVGKKNLEVGNRVQPGQPLLAIVQPDFWIVANFKETQVAHLRAGQSVDIRLDAFPGQVFKGSIESLAPGSGSQFALLPPDNATGNFTKIVQRVPVKILFEQAGVKPFVERIIPGMSATVRVRTR